MSRLTFRLFSYAAVLGAGIIAGQHLSLARETLVPFTPLLSTTRTVMDEPIVYPVGARQS
jgi:hypothetical protein